MSQEPVQLPRASPLLHLLGKQWTIPVIVALYDSRGSMQFNSLLEVIRGITPKNLSGCLKELAAAGIVDRREFASIYYKSLVGTQYSLTEKGLKLYKFIIQTKVSGESLFS